MSRLNGVAELERLLKQLPAKAEGRVLRNAMAAGARVIAKEIKTRAPSESIKDATVVRNRKIRPGKVVESEIGWTKPKSSLVHLHEYGTAPRYHKSGKFVGAMPATPFVRPSIAAGSEQALQKIGQIAARGVAREAEKLKKGR